MLKLHEHAPYIITYWYDDGYGAICHEDDKSIQLFQNLEDAEGQKKLWDEKFPEYHHEICRIVLEQ